MDSQRRKELLNQLVEHTEQVDELSLVVLKGHLVLEETLVRIVGTFVHRPDHIPDRLGFANRVSLARSMSLDDADNTMWDLVLAVNSLRNKLAHSLDSPRRDAAYDRLIQLFEAEAAQPLEKDKEPHFVALLAIAHCLGFLGALEAEVKRFKFFVDELDEVVNPHRHQDSDAD